LNNQQGKPMNFHEFNGRCAVSLKTLDLPASREEIVSTLYRLEFRIVNVDIVAQAQSCIRFSEYRRGARISEAPQVFDCSSFIQWLYGRCGIEIPRRTIQQREFGRKIEVARIKRGDLVFTTGTRNYYLDDPEDNVGHVAMATSDGSVIHAVNSHGGVKESPVSNLTASRKFRGARRIVEDWGDLMTLVPPPRWEVRTSDDVRWILLQHL
jgi:hypothetical protein